GIGGIIAASMFPAVVPSSVLGRTAPSNRINIGQIGFGRIARSHDLPEILKNEIAHVMAVADVDRKRLQWGKEWIEQQYAKKTGKSNYVYVYVYDNYYDLNAICDLFTVVIITPNQRHAQPAMEAALAGNHIKLQKPTSLTVREG